MNIGTQTNSLVNHLYSRMTVKEPAPVVGMAATTLSWTDRHAATVTKVTAFGGVKLWSYEIEVVEDTVMVISGSAHDGSAVFVSVPNPDGYANLYRKSRKTGEWVRGYINRETGRFNKAGGGLILGRRDHHIDPSF